jgi:hypothetical protein
LRTKKKRSEQSRESIERPMSWEGELSETEMTTIKPVSSKTFNSSILSLFGNPL